MSDSNNEPTTSQALTPYQERMVSLRENITHGVPTAIVPRSFAEAQSFAAALASSELVPYKLRQRAPDVLMIILAGAELEIPPVRALGLFHVIEGVPKLSADGIAARATAAAACEYLEPIEQSATRVVWRGKRRGRPETTLAWTIEEARNAGLVRKNKDGSPGNWERFPRQMLNARCKADLARQLWPEVCAGLQSAEEAYDGAIDAEFRDVSPKTFSAPPPATVTATTNTAPPANEKPPAEPKSETPKKPRAGRVVDTTATETKSAPEGKAAASGTPAGSATSPTMTPTGSAPAPEVTRPDPTPSSSSPPPTSQSAPPPQASSGPVATPSSSPAEQPQLSVSAAAADDSGFGGEDPVDSEQPRTIDGFRRALAAIAKGPEAAAALERVKVEWMPWSKTEEGLPHARAMREAYAKAKAELGV